MKAAIAETILREGGSNQCLSILHAWEAGELTDNDAQMMTLLTSDSLSARYITLAEIIRAVHHRDRQRTDEEQLGLNEF